MGDVLKKIADGSQLVLTFVGVDVVRNSDQPNVVIGEELLGQSADLDVITPQAAEVFRYHKVGLPALDGFQHPFQVGALHVQPRVAIVLIDCNNLPSLLLAVVFQHIPLVCNAGALPVKVIVLGKPAINSRPEAARQYCVHACIFHSVHHNRLPAQSRRNTVMLNLVFIIL